MVLEWLSDAAHVLQTTVNGASSALTAQCTALNSDEPSVAHLGPHLLAPPPSGIGIEFATDPDGTVRAKSFRAGAEHCGVRKAVHTSCNGDQFDHQVSLPPCRRDGDHTHDID